MSKIHTEAQALYYHYEVLAGYPASSVPLWQNDKGQWIFADGAYDVFDLFYQPGIDSDEEDTDYAEFERVAIDEVAPKLMSMEKGAQVSRNIRGIHFIFSLSDISF